ncbi:LytR/AlgR family response regulator transcription factor [Snuella lapsa]|uniref:LytTR family DNA-binding domain-containing protein n=1 Tax=Snuella lapsa TaxID=870481 RepID=A0ABP6WZ11_9FLAO
MDSHYKQLNINMEEIKYRTLIIDDEHPAREFIKELLQAYSNDFQIIGEATNGIEAIQLIKALNPDVIFLDIQMSGKNGFEVLQSLDNIPMVIFCTAFDNYALQAFETNSIDYLVKPINPIRFKNAIKKLKNLNNPKEHNKIKKLIQTYISKQTSNPPTSLPVRIGDRIVFIKIDEIAFFKAKDKYVEIHNLMGKSYILDQSLIILEQKLPEHFIRVQRSYIINTNKIVEIKKYAIGKYILLMDDVYNTKIISGKNYSTTINNLTKI